MSNENVIPTDSVAPTVGDASTGIQTGLGNLVVTLNSLNDAVTDGGLPTNIIREVYENLSRVLSR